MPAAEWENTHSVNRTKEGAKVGTLNTFPINMIDFIQYYIPHIFNWVLWIDVLVFLPLILIKKIRPYLGFGFGISASIMGMVLWIQSCIIVYDYWGLAAVILGFIFAVVGMIPLALIALLVNGNWATIGTLLILMTCTAIAVILGIVLISKTGNKS